MSKLLTDDEIRWAHRKWCEGYSTYEIAKSLHVAQSTLYRDIQARGLTRERPALKYTPDWRGEYQNGTV